MKGSDRRKIVLVGTGMVGMSYAFALLNQNLCDELLRKNQNKINSDELKEYFNEIYKVKNMIEQYED